MTIVRWPLLALLIAGCSSKSEPTPPPPAPKPSAIALDAAAQVAPVSVDAAAALEVVLTAQPQQLTMADRKKFKLKVAVTNRTADTIDPKLGKSELLINGAPSDGWAMTLANTGHSAKWNALPAGDNTGGAWSIGERLFDKPGDYTLQLRVSDTLSAPVQIHVSER